VHGDVVQEIAQSHAGKKSVQQRREVVQSGGPTEVVPIGMFDSLESDSYHAEESRVADKC
jgi:hypothetical protein